jgi:SAM-dependent methyltransferase
MNNGQVDSDAATCMSDPCLVCAGIEHSTLYAATFKGSLEEASCYFLAHRTATAHGSIMRCRNCGFVFTSPRFSADEYDRIYSAIRSPGDSHPAFAAAQAARFRRLGAIVRRYQPPDVPFLDFGCGEGGFLRHLDSRAGRGFEVGPDGCWMAGPCEVVTGSWASVAGSSIFPPESLHFVTAFDVFEHLPAIDSDIARLYTVLKPGGLLFASVPNIESLTAKLMGRRWSMLLLEHLWYFSPATLQRIMARHGFEQLAIRAMSFDAPIAHLASRLAQSVGMTGNFAVGPVSKTVVPVPAGIMLGIFQKTA